MAANNKKGSPENQSAQHLANLLGVDVAGFKPQPMVGDPPPEQIIAELLSGKRKVEGFDIEKCLSSYSTYLWYVEIEFIPIAYLLRVDDQRRIELLGEIDPELISRSVARFFFVKVKEVTLENSFSVERVQGFIESCGEEAFNGKISPILKLTLYQWWFRTLATEPTTQQFESALSILKEVKAKKK